MISRYVGITLVLAVAVAFQLQTASHPSFEEFLATNSKKYSSQGEYYYRRAVYRTNLELIDRQNAE
jgi:hypothetical protein